MSPKFCPIINKPCKESKCAFWDYNTCLVYLYLGSNIVIDNGDDEDHGFVSSSFDRSFWKKLKDLRDLCNLEDYR
jgi:hypothetical protein